MMNVQYNQDYAAWAAHQAQLLKLGHLSDLDIENLIEEMEAMSRKEHRELLRRMGILIAHLLKWTHQPTYRGNSWRRTIIDQRQEIADLIEDSPSLAHHFDDVEWIEKAWLRGVQLAENETGIKNLPKNPIWAIDEILTRDFMSE